MGRNMIRQLFILVVLFGLAACGKLPDSPTETSDQTLDSEIATLPETSDTTQPEAEPEIPAGPGVATTSPPRSPLNLSLPADRDQPTEQNFDFKKPATLPNLFAVEKHKEKKKLAVGAKVLSDPTKEKNYVESVNGAELKIEILTTKP